MLLGLELLRCLDNISYFCDHTMVKKGIFSGEQVVDFSIFSQEKGRNINVIQEVVRVTIKAAIDYDFKLRGKGEDSAVTRVSNEIDSIFGHAEEQKREGRNEFYLEGAIKSEIIDWTKKVFFISGSDSDSPEFP